MENKAFDLIAKGRTHKAKELVQLLLLIQRILDVLQMRDDFGLDVRWQRHVLHSSVCSVDLVLELLTFLVQIRYDQRHVTEDVRVNNSASYYSERDKRYLVSTTWYDIIPGQQQH